MKSVWYLLGVVGVLMYCPLPALAGGLLLDRPIHVWIMDGRNFRGVRVPAGSVVPEVVSGSGWYGLVNISPSGKWAPNDQLCYQLEEGAEVIFIERGSPSIGTPTQLEYEVSNLNIPFDYRHWGCLAKLAR